MILAGVYIEISALHASARFCFLLVSYRPLGLLRGCGGGAPGGCLTHIFINAPKRTTRSRNARHTLAACGTRGRCTPAAAAGLQIPPQLLATPTSSTPACWRSGVATIDSSTTAPGCRRGARRALPRARSRRIEHSGPRRCSPRSPACPASSPSLCANQPASAPSHFSATTWPRLLRRAVRNAPPRHRAGVTSMAWRTTRRNAP